MREQSHLSLQEVKEEGIIESEVEHSKRMYFGLHYPFQSKEFAEDFVV